MSNKIRNVERLPPVTSNLLQEYTRFGVLLYSPSLWGPRSEQLEGPQCWCRLLAAYCGEGEEFIPAGSYFACMETSGLAKNSFILLK